MKNTLFVFSVVWSALLLPVSVVLAAEPVSLLALEGVFGSAVNDLPRFFNQLFNITLFIGATLAVLMIAIGGLQYMLAEASVTTIEAARRRMTQAILGLLMLLSVYLFYNQINPKILEIDFDLSPVTVTGSKLAPPPTGVRNIKMAAAAKVLEEESETEAAGVKLVRCGGSENSCSFLMIACRDSGGVGKVTPNQSGSKSVVICAEDRNTYTTYMASDESKSDLSKAFER